MDTTRKASTANGDTLAPRVEFCGDVLQQIRQHARGSMHAEICGVLIGDVTNGITHVSARIAGEGAAQGGAHVTFTQDAWEHIYKIKDSQFPSQTIVGWYHSHPGFGIFLSEYDLFIHENFFNAPNQVAWVFDPHSDEEGCFGWIGKKVEPLQEVAVTRKHRPPAPEQTQREAASGKSDVECKPPIGTETTVDHARQRRPIALILCIVILAFLGGFAFRHYLPGLKRAISTVVKTPTRQSGPSAPEPIPAPRGQKLRNGPTLPIEIVVFPSRDIKNETRATKKDKPTDSDQSIPLEGDASNSVNPKGGARNTTPIVLPPDSKKEAEKTAVKVEKPTDEVVDKNTSSRLDDPRQNKPTDATPQADEPEAIPED